MLKKKAHAGVVKERMVYNLQTECSVYIQLAYTEVPKSTEEQ